eukprot:jgi/Ulvmu1/8454/UM043_0034.1
MPGVQRMMGWGNDDSSDQGNGLMTHNKMVAGSAACGWQSGCGAVYSISGPGLKLRLCLRQWLLLCDEWPAAAQMASALCQTCRCICGVRTAACKPMNRICHPAARSVQFDFTMTPCLQPQYGL